MRGRWTAVVAIAGLAVASATHAQMPDPSAMSGIPRPDGTVPAGGLVVRLIRGDFAHAIAGVEVALEGPGGRRTSVAGEDGRAHFEGLAAGGPYTVSARSGAQALTSQPITMLTEMGSKVMLVFAPDAAAEREAHDGVARPDPSVPAGTLLVHVVGAGDQPLPRLPLVLARGRAPDGGAPQVEQIELITDEQGEARYTPTGAIAGTGFLVSVRHEHLLGASRPFSLDAGTGMRVRLRASPISRDGSALVIGRRSHVIFDVKDEGVEVMENFSIENSAGVPFDPGPDGIVFRLPDDARGAQIVGDAPPPNLALAGTTATLRGPIKQGETHVALGFVLPMRAGVVELRQSLPLRMEQLVAISSHFAGMEVRGDGIRADLRKLGGRTFHVVNGPPIAAGGVLRLEIAGLPSRSQWPQLLAIAVAALVALWALYAAALARVTGGGEQQRLVAERKRLLDELAALDAKGAGGQDAGAAHAPRRAELMERLERAMRELDDFADGTGRAS